jgi:rhodanese-related sulfurtransferase
MTRQRSKSTWCIVLLQMTTVLLVAGAIALLVNHLRSDRLPLVADWSPKAKLTLSSGDTLMISLEDAEEHFLNHTALFLDARPHDLYQLGHIQGARSLPWEELDAGFAAAMSGVPSDTLIIAYCDGEGCGLSKELAEALLGKGYGNVRVLSNGWTLWQEQRLPVAKGELSGE